MSNERKPLGGKSYGSIPHLPGSRTGPKDYTCHEGQARICCEKARDRHDRIIVQEKLDGSNVGAARIEGEIVALTRAGYLASTSPYEQHHRWAEFVDAHRSRFLDVLNDGERIAGEWLWQAHGTRYALPHEPFVAFDILHGKRRITVDDLIERVGDDFEMPYLIHSGSPCSIADALDLLGSRGWHGALDGVEGAVWRVERNVEIRPGAREWRVDFLAKYVRPEKVDGRYLPEISGQPALMNTWSTR